MCYVNIFHDDCAMICLNTKSADQMVQFLKLLPLYLYCDSKFSGYVTCSGSDNVDHYFDDVNDYLVFLEDLI